MIHMSVVSSASYNNHMVDQLDSLPQCGCGLMGEHFTGSIHSKFNNLKLNQYMTQLKGTLPLCITQKSIVPPHHRRNVKKLSRILIKKKKKKLDFL